MKCSTRRSAGRDGAKARARRVPGRDTPRDSSSTIAPAETCTRLLADLESVRGAADTLGLDVDRTFTSYGVGTAPEVAVRSPPGAGRRGARTSGSARAAEKSGGRTDGVGLDAPATPAARADRGAGLRVSSAARSRVARRGDGGRDEVLEPAAPRHASRPLQSRRRRRARPSAARRANRRREPPLLDQLTGLDPQVEQRIRPCCAWS
jgi:hypothetical protein